MTTAFASELNNVAPRTASTLSSYFAEQFTAVTPAKVLIALILGTVTGLIIAFVYKKCYRGVLYSPNMAMTLAMLTIITTPVVMCIKNDLALSMGMVGALSIVRFRTAVKDPMDTAYMFWALTMGILLGAELYVVSIVVALGISVILFVMTNLKFNKQNNYLLVVHYESQAEFDVDTALHRMVKMSKLRSKTVTRNGGEMTYEVRLDNKQDIVSQILDIEGVNDATLVACQTEVGD